MSNNGHSDNAPDVTCDHTPQTWTYKLKGEGSFGPRVRLRDDPGGPRISINDCHDLSLEKLSAVLGLVDAAVNHANTLGRTTEAA